MKSVNAVMLVGRVGADPELRRTARGADIATFSLATDRHVKEGEDWKKVPDWHKVVAWEHNAKVAGELIRKGDPVAILGEIRTNKWQDSEGNHRKSVEIHARRISCMGSSRQDHAVPARVPVGHSPDLPQDAEIPY